MIEEIKVFVPIYEKDGNEFFFAHTNYAATTEEEAREIGYASLSDCMIYGYKYTGKTIKIDPKNTAHVKAVFGSLHACIISGPLFEMESNNGN
jgi:hypothetical protein